MSAHQLSAVLAMLNIRSGLAILFLSLLPYMATGQEIVVAVEKTTYVIGEMVEIRYQTPTNGPLVPGWTSISVHDLVTDQYFGSQTPLPGLGSMRMQAPPEPGEYEIVYMHGLDADRRVLKRVPINVVNGIPPGVSLAIDKEKYVIGERMTIRYSAPFEGYFTPSWTFVSTAAADRDDCDGCAFAGHFGVEAGDHEVSSYAPDRPGSYVLNYSQGIGDSTRTLVRVPYLVVLGTPIDHALDIVGGGESFTPGSEITLQVMLPENRFQSWPNYPGVRLELTSAPDGSIESAYVIWATSLPAQEYSTRDEMVAALTSITTQFVVPVAPGRYLLRIYDRYSDGYELARLPIYVSDDGSESGY